MSNRLYHILDFMYTPKEGINTWTRKWSICNLSTLRIRWRSKDQGLCKGLFWGLENLKSSKWIYRRNSLLLVVSFWLRLIGLLCLSQLKRNLSRKVCLKLRVDSPPKKMENTELNTHQVIMEDPMDGRFSMENNNRVLSQKVPTCNQR